MRIENSYSPRSFLLLSYISMISFSIYFTPAKNDDIEKIGAFMSRVPAFTNLIDISHFPAKTTIWIASSIALFPITLTYCLLTSSKEESSKYQARRKAFLGIAIIAALITPFLLVDSYRIGMKRSGFIISFISKSEWLILAYGPLISIAYSLTYSMFFALAYRAYMERSQ